MRCRLGLLILLLLPAGRTLSPPELRTPGGAPAPYPTRRSAGLQHDFGTGDEGDESWRGVEKDRSMCIALRISLSLSFSLSFSLSLARALSHPFPPPTHTHTPHTPPTHTHKHTQRQARRGLLCSWRLPHAARRCRTSAGEAEQECIRAAHRHQCPRGQPPHSPAVQGGGVPRRLAILSVALSALSQWQKVAGADPGRWGSAQNFGRGV